MKKIKIFLIAILIILSGFVFGLCLKKEQSQTQQVQIYDGTKKCTLVEEKECNKDGKNCKTKNIYEYKNGYKYEYYSPNRTWLEALEIGKLYPEIHIYNKNGNKISEHIYCDKKWKNCAEFNKYEYDKNNNMIKEYKRCENDLNNCKGIAIFEYDKQNNKIGEKMICNNSYIYGIFCGKSNKYVYDTNHNIIESYERCDISFDSCGLIQYNFYDEYNNLIKTKRQGYTSNRYYENYDFYTYDINNNPIETRKQCDKNSNNCFSVLTSQYKYDSNNNILEDEGKYHIDKYKYEKNELVEEIMCEKNSFRPCELIMKKKLDENGNLIEYYHDNQYSKYIYECK